MIPDLYTSLCEYQQKFNNNYYYFPLTDKINYLQENLVKTNQVYFWSQGNRCPVDTDFIPERKETTFNIAAYQTG